MSVMLSMTGSDNELGRWTLSILASLGAVLALPPRAFAATPSLVEDLERIEAGALPLCPLPPDRRPLGLTIAELADQLRAEVDVSAGGDAPARALGDFVFKKLAIRPSPDLNDPCNLLPSAVLARKQGYCVGIAAVYLAFAEGLGLPIHAVATPSHVFLRYDGEERINIETLERGALVSDDRYIAEQKIAPRSIRKGVFLRDLTSAEFIAQVHNNLGVIYSERGDYPTAAREYDAALALLPKFPAAFYNLGNDLLKTGEYRQAARAFTRCLKLHPNDAWALDNRGQAYRLLGDLKKARRDFEAALRLDPAFAPARANLDALKAGAPPAPPDSPGLD
jgi:regulator of sirC expression with transglutaminase-like and TPR domain